VLALESPSIITGIDGTAAGLTLANAEYLGATIGAGALCSRSLVLQGDRSGIPHLNFFPAFHAISLHLAPPILSLPSRVALLRLFVNSYRHKNIVFYYYFL
jgi:hypothetical protein